MYSFFTLVMQKCYIISRISDVHRPYLLCYHLLKIALFQKFKFIYNDNGINLYLQKSVKNNATIFIPLPHSLKKVVSKILVESNFTFTSYGCLCALALLHRLLNKFSDTRHFAKSGCNFIRKWFLKEPFGEMCFLEELQIDAKMSNLKASST